jgi:hypothetical protein
MQHWIIMFYYEEQNINANAVAASALLYILPDIVEAVR